MQNLLLYIKNNLTPTLAQILLQALKNSNNEKFFTFVLENIETICTWLNSSEFKNRYLSIKHPYPPLINPNFIEIDASRHCAELAWDLNLPLPKHYKFIYISPHGVGAAAFLRYLNQCCDVTCFASWVLPPDAKERYCLNYMCLNDNTITQYAINISEINLPYFDKYLSLLDFNSKIICGVRDPIGILKHNWGRDWSKVLRNYPSEFNLTYDWRYYIDYLA
ncbi:TPA: invasion protein, partial [Campylobacter jejuni]|nr:invasion protein [Campylobacter jejuni]